MIRELEFPAGPGLQGWLTLGVELTLQVADDRGMTTLGMAPHPDDADRLAAAIVEWAAVIRARQHRNSQPDLLGILP